MKKIWSKQRLILCLCITFFLPYIPLTQGVESGTLWLGFPYKFYTVYTQNDFSVHFSIGSFLLDVFIIYLICTVLLVIADKAKKSITKERL